MKRHHIHILLQIICELWFSPLGLDMMADYSEWLDRTKLLEFDRICPCLIIGVKGL